VLGPLIFGLVISAAVLGLGYGLPYFRSRARRRLLAHAPIPVRPKLLRLPEEDKATLLPPEMVAKIEKKIGLAKDSPKVRDLKKILQRAGIYNEKALNVVLGLKLGLALALPLLLLPFLWGRGLAPLTLTGILALALVGGYFLPTLVVRQMMESRQAKIRQGLPDALDLLVVCVEAGQGLNAALKRVADDFRLTNPPLAQEFALVNLEIGAGLERELALRHLAERTGVEEVESLCSILIQSDRFGTSMATALRVQSDTLRTKRRQKLEEQAAKTPVKLLFPLLLCIFPAIMVVIMGPAVIRVMETLLKK